MELSLDRGCLPNAYTRVVRPIRKTMPDLSIKTITVNGKSRPENHVFFHYKDPVEPVLNTIYIKIAPFLLTRYPTIRCGIYTGFVCICIEQSLTEIHTFLLGRLVDIERSIFIEYMVLLLPGRPCGIWVHPHLVVDGLE